MVTTIGTDGKTAKDEEQAAATDEGATDDGRDAAQELLDALKELQIAKEKRDQSSGGSSRKG